MFVFTPQSLDSKLAESGHHNILLIITFGENDNKTKLRGLTDPASSNSDIKNRVPTLITGADIVPGNYEEGKGITYVDILRTIEKMYNLPPSGHQQANALKYGIKDDYIIKDILR